MPTIRTQIAAAAGNITAVLAFEFTRHSPTEHQAEEVLETRTLLTNAVDLAIELVNRVYALEQQRWMRPDRYCTVEVGLLADLLVLCEFIRPFTRINQASLRLAQERAVSWPHSS
jgi:hypothetical protein